MVLYLALAMPVAVFVVFLAPLVLDPLFNNFEPLDKTNPQLVDAIEKSREARAGQSIPRDRIFLMNASKKVTTLNAYVTGFGPSKADCCVGHHASRTRPFQKRFLWSAMKWGTTC